MTANHFQPAPTRAEPHLRFICPVEFPDEWVTDSLLRWRIPG